MMDSVRACLLGFACAIGILGYSDKVHLRACEYTVRDIGFIDLDGNDYQLLVVDNRAASTLASGAELDFLTERVRDWNLELQILSRSSELLPDKVAAAKAIGLVEVWLIDRDQRALRMLSESEPIDLEQVLDRVLLGCFSHPLVASLHDRALDSFAHVLVFEGSSTEVNAATRQQVEESRLALEKISGLLPRPIEYPVRVIHIPADKSELQWLRWSMRLPLVPSATAGDSVAGSDNHLSPAVAVVYGRGKLASDPLVGRAIHVDELVAQFALIGESCECETDRAWHQLSVLPFRWDAKTRDDAIHFLGFNAGSPLVQSEVRRILARGPSSLPTTPHRADAIDSLMEVYREAGMEASVRVDRSADTGIQPNVNSTVIQGGGWGFDIEGESTGAIESISGGSPAEFQGSDLKDGALQHGEAKQVEPDGAKQFARKQSMRSAPDALSAHVEAKVDKGSHIIWYSLLAFALVIGVCAIVLIVRRGA